MNCPRDGTELHSARRGRTTYDECPACRGMWLEPRELAELVGTWSDLPRPAAAATGSLACPQGCGVMAARYYSDTLQVVLDQCPHCHGIWLDDAELRIILRGVYGA